MWQSNSLAASTALAASPGLIPSSCRTHRSLTLYRSAVAAPARPSSGQTVLLTLEEASERLGIGRTTVYALIKSGALESVQIGRLRRIPTSAVHAYAAAPHWCSDGSAVAALSSAEHDHGLTVISNVASRVLCTSSHVLLTEPLSIVDLRAS